MLKSSFIISLQRRNIECYKQKMRIKNSAYKTILKIAFLAILISYIGSTTFYNHTHIIDGERIVHSHPFTKNDNGESSHKHTSNEIQVIRILSAFNLTESIIPAFNLNVFHLPPVLLQEEILSTRTNNCTYGNHQLRAPPAITLFTV